MRITEGVRRMLNFTGVLLFAFYWLWGFNYARVPIHQQMGITLQEPDTLTLRQELMTAAEEVLNARKHISLDSFYHWSDNPELETAVRNDVTRTLQSKSFLAGGQLRGRLVQPAGVLFSFGIAGIYMPFVGESNIDAGLHPLEKPFSLAHEMAHGYGWTSEATANFVAYLSCIESSDPMTRYSGYLNYYRYVAANYRSIKPDAYKIFLRELHPAIIADLRAIQKRQNQFRVLLDTEWLNDLYLRSQGVQEGVVSYSRVVTMVFSWRKEVSK